MSPAQGPGSGRLSWRFHVLAIGLLSGAAWLGTRIATAPLDEPAPPRAVVAADRETAPAGGGERRTARSAAGIEQSIARPLFVAGRRPPPPPEARADELASTSASGLSLVGVMQDGSGHPRALIRWPDQPSTWVGVGEQVHGWRVGTIEGTRVVIEGAGGGRQELSLYSPR